MVSQKGPMVVEVESPPLCDAAAASARQKVPIHLVGGSLPQTEVHGHLEDHLDCIVVGSLSNEALVPGAEGAGAEVMMVPETQSPTSNALVEWEGRNLFGEEEKGMTLNRQWASSEGEPIPLNHLLLTELNASDWVFQMVKDLHHWIGMECVGYEEQFMALLTAIEVGHTQSKKSGSKKRRELKRLTWSLNYEGSSSRERSKGKGIAYSL